MSKTKWGAALSFFIGVIANFAPIPEAWRWGLTALAILGLIICGVGYLVSKPEQLKQTTAVSGSVFTADVSGNVVTAGRDAIQIVIGRSGEPSNTPSDVLLSSQMQELRELQEFIGGKDQSELWELFDLHKITLFNIRRAKLALNPKSISPKEALEINEFFRDGKALLSALHCKVTRTAGGFHTESIPGKLGILNLSLKHVTNRQTLAKFQSSHQLPLAVRDAIKELDKAVGQNVEILLDVINEEMVENPENVFREEDAKSPLFGATSGAFLDKRVWLKPKQEEIIKQVRLYLKVV